VAPTTGGARHGPRPASAVTPQPHRVAPRAPPRATMPPPGWTRDVLERGRELGCVLLSFWRERDRGRRRALFFEREMVGGICTTHEIRMEAVVEMDG
jgi:hypothetical protein